MLPLLVDELQKYDVFGTKLPDIIERVADAIPFENIPLRMKYTIAVSEVMLYASQFRRNMQMWDGTSVPINSVAFVITGSGQNKDSSVNAARRCFNVGYEMINDRRKNLAKRSAIKQAQEAGVEPPFTYDKYKQFYRTPNPLFVAISTNEGFIQHLNDLDYDGIGSGYMYSGEVGAELANSPVFTDNLKLISEVYDLGNKEVKVLKARENQSREIKGLPVSALFVGSPANILYDESIKRKFKLEFATKLARRSWFCFVPQVIEDPSFESIDQMLDFEEQLEARALAAREAISDGIRIITEYNLSKAGTEIVISEDVHRLFTIYRRYNNEVAETLPKLCSISVLVRKHLQWKALKLAGAIALFNQQDTVELDDYVEAIHFCEMLDRDMQMFENELVKEPYEVFADYMQSIAQNNKSFITVHALRKHGYIPTTAGKTDQKLKELCYLAASYDPTGIYSVQESGIAYERIQQTNVIHVCYKPIDNTPIYSAIAANASKDDITRAKQAVARTANSGLETIECTFADLAELLQTDTAYSPFRFKDGIRDRNNLLPGTKWLVLDVDDSCITAQEAHLLLEDINHHIALSSDATNNFKFRVLIELDSIVDVDPITWKHFYLSIADSLSLTVDHLPQSQIFYAYSKSPVYSVLDAEPIAVRDHLMFAANKSKESLIEKPLTTTQMESAIADPYTTFNYAYECPNNGSGSRNLIRAAKHAKDLKMPKQNIIDLMYDINDYWTSPMPEDRLEQTILSQIRRW